MDRCFLSTISVSSVMISSDIIAIAVVIPKKIKKYPTYIIILFCFGYKLDVFEIIAF